jgi:hypothetical protein
LVREPRDVKLFKGKESREKRGRMERRSERLEETGKRNCAEDSERRRSTDPSS